MGREEQPKEVTQQEADMPDIQKKEKGKEKVEDKEKEIETENKEAMPEKEKERDAIFQILVIFLLIFECMLICNDYQIVDDSSVNRNIIKAMLQRLLIKVLLITLIYCNIGV